MSDWTKHDTPSPILSGDARPEAPTYRKVLDLASGATPLYFIVCDEGWRETIVCSGMYETVADWLLEILGRRPYGGTP